MALSALSRRLLSLLSCTLPHFITDGHYAIPAIGDGGEKKASIYFAGIVASFTPAVTDEWLIRLRYDAVIRHGDAVVTALLADVGYDEVRCDDNSTPQPHCCYHDVTLLPRSNMEVSMAAMPYVGAHTLSLSHINYEFIAHAEAHVSLSARHCCYQRNTSFIMASAADGEDVEDTS